MLIHPVFYVVVFVFGVCVGSFLNCLIYRMEKGKSFVKGRSFCPNCKQGLRWQDLIPVLSFVVLRGKCRYCKKKISWQYPAVEIATGLLFLLIFNFQFSHLRLAGFGGQAIFNFVYLLIIASLLLIIFVFDFKHFIIPDKVVFLGIGLAFLFGIWNLGFHWSLGLGIWDFKGLVNLFTAAFCTAGFFFIIWLVSRGKWMGFGDVKLAFLIGLLLNFPNILVALFFSFFIGAIIGLGLILLGKKRLKSEVPFGPFLVMGTFIALFWGKEIIHWYLGLL